MSSCKVVILNWNGREHLRRFLPSVVATTPPQVSIIVADNGSTDDSLAVLHSEFPRVEVVKLDRNYGFAEGYNRALKSIESDYYILLNSDVETTQGWCTTLIEFMDRNPQAAAVAPKLRAVCERDKFEYAGAAGGYIDMLGYPFCRGRMLSHTEYDDGQYDSVAEVFWASGAALMIRSEVFHELGGFDGDFFAHMEEIDLCWRAQLAGYKIYVEPHSVVYHLGGGTLAATSPRKVFLNHRNNLWMLYKNLSPASLWWVIGVRLVLDGAAAVSYLMSGRIDFVRSVWRAHVEFYGHLSKLRVQRRTIQESVVRRSHTIYRGSIILRYLFGYKCFAGCTIAANRDRGGHSEL